MKIALDPTPFHHDNELLEFPRVVADFDVLVARAVTDGNSLDLVLRPGGIKNRQTLTIGQLRPGHAYRTQGAGTPRSPPTRSGKRICKSISRIDMKCASSDGAVRNQVHT